MLSVHKGTGCHRYLKLKVSRSGQCCLPTPPVYRYGSTISSVYISLYPGVLVNGYDIVSMYALDTFICLFIFPQQTSLFLI